MINTMKRRGKIITTHWLYGLKSGIPWTLTKEQLIRNKKDII